MKLNLVLCLARGLLYTYCLILPYGLFVAWTGIRMWKDPQASWCEIVLGALGISFYTFATWWYFSLPLVAAIAWWLYLRRQAKDSLNKQSPHAKP